MSKFRGTGAIAASDFKAVKWVGLTKGGKPVTIEMEKALNMGNIDWTFAEKNDTVAQVVFTGVYSNTDGAPENTDEPWTLEVDGSQSGASNILLGAGKFYIGGELIALTRGGGQFVVEREFRQINADGDRGAVEGRVTIDASVPTLTLNALEFLTNVADIYAGIATVQ